MRKLGVVCAVCALVAVFATGCDESATCPVDTYGCSEFEPGTDMSASDFGGTLELKPKLTAYAQGVGEMSVLAGRSSSAVLAACRNIALDLGADPTANASDQTPATWCGKATNEIESVLSTSVAGHLELDITPGRCEISLVALQNCQSSCGQPCGFDSTPPQCAGGEIDATCDGTCSPLSQGEPYDCVGSCSGSCGGQCVGSLANATSCIGICDGVCSAVPSQPGAVGIMSDGTCNGKCAGTCTSSQAFPCDGSCIGTCDDKCSFGAGVEGIGPLTCSGQCSGTKHAVSCINGKVTGGCTEDAVCQSSCNAAAQADEACVSVDVRVAAMAVRDRDGAVALLAATVERNYPALLSVIRDQGQPMMDQCQALVDDAQALASSSGLDVYSRSCLAQMVLAGGNANSNLASALQAARMVSTALGGPT